MSTFPRSPKSKLGYDVEQVDAFLESARTAYDDQNGDQGGDHRGDHRASRLTAAEIRHTAFSMQKGGYSTTHVDAALERLEDAFAARERESARTAKGDGTWLEEARTTAQEILNRLDRPVGKRFDRVSVLTLGYNRQDVDRFANRLVKYFQDGRPMSVDEVRTVTFREQRGGYREVQVDLLLDSVTDVMLAVR
ncbi:DivIVA domain-containing protein [Leifsonia sp. F6_8S_P_1B]|uniref:DivIVA domain-containing protein n=1 Tax=Leifsonia williamsii TaxID=3035919 RepID=A0ABT8KCY8_9MICO|nr:DivIVA domain-containing protein [Leifsonia williamsii]MDN4615042.1 DivIVA domain-containing protein [Leifsonia williamsii]